MSKKCLNFGGLYNRFEELTAKVGINKARDWKYVLNHDIEWGELNWTREICVFCFDFLVDAIIKNQGRDFVVKRKWISELYEIQAIDEIKLYSNKGTLIYTIRKGEDLNNVFVPGRIDNQWELFNSADRILSFYNEASKDNIVGFFNEGEEIKIKFLKTKQFTRDENGESVLLKEY